MIQVIPSVSISGGKTAKLSSGETGNARLYDMHPLELAQFYEAAGFKRLHLIDLDGARENGIVNYNILQLISGYTKLDINFSGGIRSDGGVTMALEYGARTITAASVPAFDPETFMSWMITFGRERLILGVDFLDEKVAVRGWSSKIDKDAFAHVQYFYERGINNLKVTDVSRDGTLHGPNFELIARIQERFPDMRLLVSGGVRAVDDIEKLNDMGVHAVVIARAFYENKIKLEDLAKFLEPVGTVS